VLDFLPDLGTTFYDHTPYDYSELDQWRATAMLEDALAQQPPGRRRLDAGCGGGRNLASLVDGTHQVVAVDLSLRSVCRAAARFPIRAARCSILSLPFLDGSFDFVVCDGVAHHTTDPPRALAEVARVTAPGGRIYAAVYRAGTLYHRLYRHVGGVLRTARRIEDRGLAPGFDKLAFTGYRLANRLLKPARRDDPAALRAIYEDYFHTPIASFHDRAWLESVLAAHGAVVDRIESHGNVWRALARKR
jgi:SAM-dependent methyltransferase